MKRHLPDIILAIWIIILALLMAAVCPVFATTYYVDTASAGGDGTTQATSGAQAAFATVAAAQAAITGDQSDNSLLFKCGCTWVEKFTQGAYGTAGHPFTVGSYGVGAAPRLTGLFPITATGSWTDDGSNIWKATVTATAINYCLFDGVGGTKMGAKASCVAPKQYYFASNILYVYATSNPATYYGTVSPIKLQKLIINTDKSYVIYKQLKLDWFDGGGIDINGTSTGTIIEYCLIDKCVVYNGDANAGGIRYGSPSGAITAYVYNCSIMRCNYGINVQAADAATVIMVKNTNAYASLSTGFRGTNVLTLYNSHSYGSGAGKNAIMESSGYDTNTIIDGGGNISWLTSPNIVNYSQYSNGPLISIGIDDVGLAADGTILNPILAQANARGLKMSLNVTPASAVTNYPTFVAQMQGWQNDGHDITAHGWAHQDYTLLNVFTIQYVGAAAACTMTISGNILSTSTTGAVDDISLDLTSASYDTVVELVNYINGLAAYTCTKHADTYNAVHTVALGDVVAQDIKTAPYVAQNTKARLVPDEMNTSKAWIEANGIPGTICSFYTYPFTKQDSTTWAYAVAAGYVGARGGLYQQAPSTLENGSNVQNIYNICLLGLAGMSVTEITNQIRRVVLYAGLWGIPICIYSHPTELTPTEWGAVMDGLEDANNLTSSAMATYLASLPVQTGYFHQLSPTNTPDFHLKPNSPCINAGVDVGLTTDYEGKAVPQGGAVDIGAYEYNSSGTWMGH